MKRPATQLVSDLNTWINAAEEAGETTCLVPLDTMKAWKLLATQPDARSRLDGSKLNRHKKPKSK